MSVLERIVTRTRADLERRRRRLPLATLERDAKPSTRSLIAAIRQPGPRFIFECKRASPSAGTLRAQADPAAVARAYAPLADAVSVLTDTPYFGGSQADLATVRAELRQPVLCKDFIVDPYQVVEARCHGADAVLLMLSVLDERGYRACAARARELGMDVLTEIHDEPDLVRALALEARLIGINNRDLATLEVDVAVTERLAPLIPADRVVVSESGIASHADVMRLAPLVDGFLVGSALMRQAHLELATRALVFGRIKVCGLTSPAQARAADAAGACYGGLIFVPDSPRCIGAAEAVRIAAASPLPLVGVFADAPIGQIAGLTAQLPLAAVQLHGGEQRATVAALRAALPAGVEIWKAVDGDAPPASAAVFGADRLLFDNGGGSGRCFDWRHLSTHPERERSIVAGGISPANATEAAALGCFALDVNSGVETAPGIKDAAALADLFARLAGRSDT